MDSGFGSWEVGRGVCGVQKEVEDAAQRNAMQCDTEDVRRGWGLDMARDGRDVRVGAAMTTAEEAE